jgi:hypothetical protein
VQSACDWLGAHLFDSGRSLRELLYTTLDAAACLAEGAEGVVHLGSVRRVRRVLSRLCGGQGLQEVGYMRRHRDVVVPDCSPEGSVSLSRQA